MFFNSLCVQVKYNLISGVELHKGIIKIRRRKETRMKDEECGREKSGLSRATIRRLINNSWKNKKYLGVEPRNYFLIDNVQGTPRIDFIFVKAWSVSLSTMSFKSCFKILNFVLILTLFVKIVKLTHIM